MGAWSLGREAALAKQLPRQARELAKEPQDPQDTLSDLAGKVLAWIPGEVVVLYGALITLFVQNDAEKIGDSASVVLTIGGVVFAGLFVLLAAFASTSGAGWLTMRIKGRAVLASIAFLIWSLTVPNSGWNEFDWIADHPIETAAIAGVVGLVFSLLATGVDNRLGDEAG
jgi:hypothetical protein